MATSRSHTAKATAAEGLTLDELRAVVADLEGVDGRAVVQARVGFKCQVKQLTVDEDRLAPVGSALG